MTSARQVAACACHIWPLQAQHHGLMATMGWQPCASCMQVCLCAMCNTSDSQVTSVCRRMQYCNQCNGAGGEPWHVGIRVFSEGCAVQRSKPDGSFLFGMSDNSCCRCWGDRMLPNVIATLKGSYSTSTVRGQHGTKYAWALWAARTVEACSPSEGCPSGKVTHHPLRPISRGFGCGS
jgi:hypothetical protein